MLKHFLIKAFNHSIDLTIHNQPDTKKGPKVYICNHTSFADGAILAGCIDNPVFVVHEDLAKSSLYRFVLKFIDHVLVSSSHPMGVREIFKYIKKGRNIVIFPEGRLTVTGSLMKVYPGAAYLAFKTQVPIVPIYIHGLVSSVYSKLKGDNPDRWIPKTDLYFGPEISPNPNYNKKTDLNSSTKILKDSLVSLAFNSMNQSDCLHHALLDSMKTYGNHRIIFEELDSSTISYKKFYQISHALGYLVNKKLDQPENTVGVFLPNVTPSAALLFGLSIYKKTAAMLNYSMGQEPFESCLDTAQIKTIITSSKFIKEGSLQRFITYMNNKNVRIIYLEDFKKEVSLIDKLTILKRFYSKFEITNDLTNNIILFTSGSEGLPKGVVLSHKAILSNVNQIKSSVDISVNDKIFNAMPMFHSFGLTAGTILPILTGSKIVLYPSPLHYKKIPEYIYEKDCTVLFGTNTFLSKYAKEANPYDFFRLRYVVAGAEKVLESTRQQWFESFGIRILEGYGATECAPVLAVNTPAANKFNTVGKFLPLINYQLESIPGVDPSSPNSKCGKLIVKCPNLFTGYLRPGCNGVMEPASDSYDTGDIVEIDSDGFIKIVGRAKRFVKIAGEMVSLESVEKIVNNLTGTLNSAIGVEIPNKGERVILFTTNEEISILKLSNYLTQNNLSKLWLPYQIIHIKEIPLLGSGKTDYVELKNIFITNNSIN